jgi:hypothetical protein
VASNPITPTKPAEAEVQVIENELPAYRALSRAAIACLILGAASILTFLWPYFAALGALAVVCGLVAQRNIRRMPDVLTGTKIANAGTALGLLFTLSALTIVAVQYGIIDHEAGKFARQYVEALRSKSIDNAIYLENHPTFREGKTPTEVAKEYREGMSKGGMYDMQTQPIRDILKRLTSGPDQTIELGPRIGHEFQGMDAYVSYLLVLKGPKSTDFPDETQYAIVILLGTPKGRIYGWQVKNVRFPVGAPL